MILLLLASVWSWAVIIDKSFRLMRLVRKANGFERLFWSGAPLDDLYRQLAKRADHPMALMFATAMEEWRESPKTVDVTFNRGLVGRIGQVMDLTRDREVESLESNLSWLGTIASTAPFVGLLGHGLGHHEQLPGDRGHQELDPGRGGPRHRRGAVRDRARPDRGDPGADRLQQAVGLDRQLRQPARRASPRSSRSCCRASSIRRRWPERMAAAIQAGKGGGARRSRRRKRATMVAINMTPLVDVMLVLLIVFMITAPLLTAGVTVDLPEADSAPLPGQDEPLSVSIDAAGAVFIQDTPVDAGPAGAAAAGDHRAQPGCAHLRARRPGHRLRHGDGRGQRHQPGRVRQGGAAHRARAGRGGAMTAPVLPAPGGHD